MKCCGPGGAQAHSRHCCAQHHCSHCGGPRTHMASWLQSPTPDGQKHPDASHPARPGLCARAGAGVGHSGATLRSQQDRLTHRAGKCEHVYPPTVISDFRGKSARTVTRSSTERSFKGTVTRGPQTSVLSISRRHPKFPSAARQPGDGAAEPQSSAVRYHSERRDRRAPLPAPPLPTSRRAAPSSARGRSELRGVGGRCPLAAAGLRGPPAERGSPTALLLIPRNPQLKLRLNPRVPAWSPAQLHGSHPGRSCGASTAQKFRSGPALHSR